MTNTGPYDVSDVVWAFCKFFYLFFYLFIFTNHYVGATSDYGSVRWHQMRPYDVFDVVWVRFVSIFSYIRFILDIICIGVQDATRLEP